MSAGATIRVVIKDRAIGSALARLVALTESPKAVYDDIGEHLLISTRERVSRGISPDGTPFAPLNPRYAARKQEKVGDRPILEYDLHMVGDRFTYSVDDQGLLIGTGPEKAVPYGRAQQFGYKPRNLPPRPWLGLSDDDRYAIKLIVFQHLFDAIRQRF